MAPDLVLDCIDDVKAKLALMLHCRFNKIPLIVSGGAGGKLDPLKIRVADLSKPNRILCWLNYVPSYAVKEFAKAKREIRHYLYLFN